MRVPASFGEGEWVLRSLEIRDFTVFPEATLRFADGLNVIIGENGTGKTHLLELPYAVMAMSAEEDRKRHSRPTKTLLQTRIAEKVGNVFRPEGRLGRLVRRQRGQRVLEAIDAHPVVVSRERPGPATPWTVR